MKRVSTGCLQSRKREETKGESAIITFTTLHQCCNFSLYMY